LMPPEAKLDVALNCPIQIAAGESILLGHGSGGQMSGDLLRNILLPALQNPVLDRLDDQAIVDVGGARIAFTTDSFVVKPLFFPGGDIGTLAVNGTVNDLAMGGAVPLFLSLALILRRPPARYSPQGRRIHPRCRCPYRCCRCHGRHESGGKRKRGWIVCEHIGNRTGLIRDSSFRRSGTSGRSRAAEWNHR